MCYHEQIIFSCGCKARNIFPCPHRLHLERNSTINWRRVHKLTRICPKLEWDQLQIDIDCETCGLAHQDVKPYTDDFEAYKADHSAMHQRLLGDAPSYTQCVVPAWGWYTGTYYAKRDAFLKRRVIKVDGIKLVCTAEKRRQDALHNWQTQAAAWNLGRLNPTMTGTNRVAMRPPMVPQMRPRVPLRPAHQPTHGTGYGYGGNVQHENWRNGWQAPALQPMHFTAPAIPSYRNPFVAAAMAPINRAPIQMPPAQVPVQQPPMYHPPPGSYLSRPQVPSFGNPLTSNVLKENARPQHYQLPLKPGTGTMQAQNGSITAAQHANNIALQYANPSAPHASNMPGSFNYYDAHSQITNVLANLSTYGSSRQQKRGIENSEVQQVGGKRRRIVRDHPVNGYVRNDSVGGFQWSYSGAQK